MKKLQHITLSAYLLAMLLTTQSYAQDESQQSGRSYKKYTLVVFMAADNNLHPYAWNNVKQMESITSPHINILVQINFPGANNITQRYIIEKGKKTLIQTPGQAPTTRLDSGSPQTLIDCVAWAMTYYPAEHLILNLWSHGTGIYDPKSSKLFDNTLIDQSNYNNDALLYANKTDDDQIEQKYLKKRGICFDNTHKSYMNNQDIEFALHEIHHKVLRGKKIALIWLEACLMSMIEITNIFKNHANFLVSSENVEYAPGSNYQLVLSAFTRGDIPQPREFACHIVNSFKKIYEPTNLNFTQSAIDLSQVTAIEENINLVAQQILLALPSQKNKSVTKVLQKCKSRTQCTCFHEPSFIDLKNFYLNLQSNIGQINLTNATKEVAVKTMLAKLLTTGIYLINNAIIANTSGRNLKNANGLSIYFPEQWIFNSYLQSNFAQSNSWSIMLAQYILQAK